MRANHYMGKGPGPALAKVGKLERRRHLWDGEHIILSRILHSATRLDRQKPDRLRQTNLRG
jgi:hypothetical protein